jgi:PhzF family phenazine biosynthesis protein
MKTLDFKKIDAFTKGLSPGNPAGYVFMERADLLSEDEMQKIAAELKGFVNEVGFVNRQDKQFGMKFFSSECEVAFCGHATIAIMYDLISTNPDLINEKELKIKVSAGTLSVFNHVKDEDAVYIMAPEPQFLEREIKWSEIAQALDADITVFDNEKTFQVIDGGLRTLIIPMASLKDCLRLYPNQENLKQFCFKNDIDIVHVFTDEVYTSDAKYRTRVFAPKYGYLEDPATGSGNSAFCYYLIYKNLWTGDFSIEQGSSLNNPNIVKVKRYEKDNVDRILFGGCGTTRIVGSYCLHDNSNK